MPEPESFDGMIQMRPYAGDAQRQAILSRGERHYGHLSPNSVLVATMSNHWGPGSWARVADMVMATNKANIQCGLHELQDRCLNWGDALGTMRNEAIMIAKSEGFEWLCYVDNDVLPEPDTLLRLIRRGQSVIVPYVVEPGNGRKLHGPEKEPSMGLQPVRWAVLSMILMRTNVFNATGPAFWQDAIGADEGVHFALLWYYGHPLILDTDTPLLVSSPPTYPLTSNRLDGAERETYWREKRKSLQKPPDRRPLLPASPHLVKGAYMPFLDGAQGVKPPGELPVPSVDWGADWGAPATAERPVETVNWEMEW